MFNNAGVGAGGLVWESSQADWEWVLGVNLWGVIHGVRLFTPMMLEAAQADPSYQGHIVNTASMAGLLTPPNIVVSAEERAKALERGHTPGGRLGAAGVERGARGIARREDQAPRLTVVR